MNKCSVVIILILSIFASSVQAENILVNPGFENGLTGWYKTGSYTISTSTVRHSGNYSALVSDRTQQYQGINQDMLGVMETGKTYKIGGWVRLQNSATSPVKITVAKKAADVTTWTPVVQTTANDTDWKHIYGYYTLNSNDPIQSLRVYFEWPLAGVNFYVDDAYVEPYDSIVDEYIQQANERIEKIRKTGITINAVAPTGEPLENVEVSLRQLRHHFAFGTAVSSSAIDNITYKRFLKKHFQYVVPENATKWPQNEKQQGVVDFSVADKIYSICRLNNIPMRGHCIFWANGDRVPQWARDLDNNELFAAMRDRINSSVGHFKDIFRHWDVNNEMLRHEYFLERFENDQSIRSWMFQAAQAVDPNCLMFVNDYGVVSGGDTEWYKSHIQGLINAGAPVGGIGVQCHFRNNLYPDIVFNRLEILADLNLPIWVTEYDLDSEDLEIRAAGLDTFYRIAFSHPSVEGILMWGFWDPAHWRDNAHLVEEDWTINLAGHAYLDLMDEWTTNENMTTDADGNALFRPFYGLYEVTLDHPVYGKSLHRLNLKPEDSPEQITLPVNAQGLNYEYYNGTWTSLPDFGTLTPASSGKVTRFDISEMTHEDEYYAIRFTGLIEIQTSGPYTFYTESDDNSKLYIDRQLVVDNDGFHDLRERSGDIELSAGLHEIIVDYGQNNNDEGLVVMYSPPGKRKQKIPASVLYSRYIPELAGNFDNNDTVDMADFAGVSGLWRKSAFFSDMLDIANNWTMQFIPGLVAQWQFNSLAGTTAKDSYLLSLDGTLNNMDDSAWTDGYNGNALRFDGNDDFVEINGYDGITGRGPRTVTAWIKTSDFYGDIISWGNTTYYGRKFEVVISSAKLRVDINKGYLQGTTIINTGVWTHIAVVLPEDSFNVADVKLYINGIEEPVTDFRYKEIDTLPGPDVTIGTSFSGTIDDLRIYNRSLTKTEIQNLMD